MDGNYRVVIESWFAANSPCALAQYWRTPAEFIIRLGGSHVNQWKAQTAHIQ